MLDLAMGCTPDVDLAERRSIPAFRTLLAGGFAAPGLPDRLLLERMLSIQASGRPHHILPGSRSACPIEQAERQLARNAVDIVLLDLDGPVEAMLTLVERLRAAAGQGVIFVGILARHATAAARLYLSAVVDEVVEGPLRAGSLHRAIADALQVAAEFHDEFGGGSFAPASQTRH